MLTCGIDVGSLSTKAVILDEGKMRATAVILTQRSSEESAQSALEKALDSGKLKSTDLDTIIGTGYGRVNIPFADGTVTEIACHAKGAQAQNEQVRTILDMGGQDCKAIRCDALGRVVNFVMNDKCAAGTGRYLERVATAADRPLEQIGERSLEGVNKGLPISSTCAVFAEADILKLIRDGHRIEDILAGAFDSLVQRIQQLLGRVGIENRLCISGGVAKNIGIVKRLERNLEMEVYLPAEPQVVGAYGAALIGLEKLCGKSMKEARSGGVQ